LDELFLCGRLKLTVANESGLDSRKCGEGNNRPRIEDFSAVKRRPKAAREEENKSFC